MCQALYCTLSSAVFSQSTNNPANHHLLSASFGTKDSSKSFTCMTGMQGEGDCPPCASEVTGLDRSDLPKVKVKGYHAEDSSWFSHSRLHALNHYVPINRLLHHL